MSYVVLGCRLLIAVVFAVAAGAKLSSRSGFAEFAASVRDLRLLPRPLATPVAVAVVAAEGAVVAAMAVAPAAGFVLAAALLTAVTAAAVAAMRHGRRVPCRCFGASGRPLGPRHVARNAVLLAAAAAGFAGLATAGASAVRPAGAVLAALAGLVAGAVVVRLDDVIDLYAQA